MQGPLSGQSPGDIPYGVLATITRQLERLEDRTRNLATRDDLDALRKDVVARDLLEPQLSLLKTQIARLNDDRINDRKEFEEDRLADRKEFEKQVTELKTESISRSDRLWMRLGQAAAFLAFALSLLQFLLSAHIVR